MPSDPGNDLPTDGPGAGPTRAAAPPAVWTTHGRPRRVLPSHDEPLTRELSTLIGGPVGRHAGVGRSRWLWTPLRVLVALTILTCTLGWLQKVQCRDTSNWKNDYQYTRLCYSDVVALYGGEGLAAGQTPYVDHPVEYPVLIGAFMGVTGELSRSFPSGTGGVDNHAARFYDITVVGLTLAMVVAVVATGLTAGRRRIWDAALLALAPSVVLHLATNWDALAVGITAVAMLLWAYRHTRWAGVVLGLAVATKLYPLAILFPLLLLCARSGKMRAWLSTASFAVLTVLLVYVPAYLTAGTFSLTQTNAQGTPLLVRASAWETLTSGAGFSAFVKALSPTGPDDCSRNAMLRFVDLNTQRGADWDSLWLALSHLRGGTTASQQADMTALPTLDPNIGGTPCHPGVPSNLNLATYLTWGVLFLGIAALALSVRRRPRLAPLCFLVLVAFLLGNKVFSPQYTLWLTPFAVLARPRWPLFLAWQASEWLLTGLRFMYFVNLDKGSRGAGYGWFVLSIGIRDILLLVLCALMVRDMVRPDQDPVRADGDDDPGGGVLDGAPDVRTLRRRERADPDGSDDADGWAEPVSHRDLAPA